MKGYKEKDVASNAWNVRAKDLELIENNKNNALFSSLCTLPPSLSFKVGSAKEVFFISDQMNAI